MDNIRYSNDTSGFVLVRRIIPEAVQEIRYYTDYNFTGTRVDGYEEAEAILSKEAAARLKDVCDDMMNQGLRLKIYDAYRPQAAVDHFMRWAADREDKTMQEIFYPHLDKEILIPKGYIAEHSSHTRGSTVDLTLIDAESLEELDMGSPFDFFGEISHSLYEDITPEQRRARLLLRTAMEAHGFVPLEEEWWHFTLQDEPYPDTYFTFPVSSEALKGDPYESA